MESPNVVVRHIKASLVKGASNLALDLAPLVETNEHRAREVEQYRNAVSKYVSSALDESSAKGWSNSIGWVYAGIHLASELVPDYISLTFHPGKTTQDPSAGQYLDGDGDFSPFNFTRFLWPSEAGRRDEFINPLDIVIEDHIGEIVMNLPPFTIVSNSECSFATSHRCNSESLPVTIPSAIIVPYQLKETFRSTARYHQIVSTEVKRAVEHFVRNAREYLCHNYYCGVGLECKISDEEIYEAVRNTMLLHKRTGLDPRSVTFFPLISGSSRIGVFCFVMSKVPREEENLHMQSFAETAMQNIFGVDSKLAKQRDKGIRKATLFLPLIAHEWRDRIATASLKLGHALRALSNNQPDEVKALLLRAKDLMCESQQYVEAFEKAVYAEVKNTRSLVNPATLERQIRSLVSPEDINRVHWIVSGDCYVEISFQPDLLCYAVWQMINNAVEAVRETSRHSENTWCVVEITAGGPEQLLINIKDIGPGFTSEQIEALNTTDFQPVQSSHSGGYGIKTTRWMIEGFGGTMEFDTGPYGTTWKVGVPTSRR